MIPLGSSQHAAQLSAHSLTEASEFGFLYCSLQLKVRQKWLAYTWKDFPGELSGPILPGKTGFHAAKTFLTIL